MGDFAVVNPAFEDDTESSQEKPNVRKTSGSGNDVPDDVPKTDFISRCIKNAWTTIERVYKNNRKAVSVTSLVASFVLFLAYFVGAIYYKIVYLCGRDDSCEWEWCNGHGFLIIISVFLFIGLLYYRVLKKNFSAVIRRKIWNPFHEFWKGLWDHYRWTRIIIYLIPFILILLFLIIDTSSKRYRLRSLLGLFVLLLLGALFSKHPGKIKWQPVLCGLLLQFIFGLITLRWETGRKIFQCFGDKVTAFLNSASGGASFVYGEALANNVFAFQVLPVIFFFSFVVQILYYWGVMQSIVLKMGWLLQITMGTTVCESVNAASSIFLGQSEAPLVIKPYIKDLTKSEIHAIMTAGFATVSGSVLAAYISFGVKAAHLLTASIMSAPAALCYSKLFYPESEESKTRLDNIHIEKGDENGVLDAATKGAMSGISLVLGITANLIAFVSAINLLDAIIGWMGELVGLEGEQEISFTFILTKVFYPLAWVMGVPWYECELVAKVVALKTVVNEFVAYEELGKYLKRNGTDDSGMLSERSELIATYALCGFSNPSSIGIVIGALSSMAPHRRADISEVAFRAFLSGCAVCFLTACVAGLLDTGEYDRYN